MRKIVSTFKNHKAILAWDLKKNNLDFENRDKDNVLNWLNHMVSVIKIRPNHLVTIGWSNSYETTRLADR
jgi:endo-1,4-beta-mannosidase